MSPNADNKRFYSFSFEMDYKIKSDERLPNLIIQCVSFDFWQNRRIEGYGHISMPTETGTHELVIPCWRPKQGLEQDLRRFFLGGSSELISPSASVGFNKNLNKVCPELFPNKSIRKTFRFLDLAFIRYQRVM